MEEISFTAPDLRKKTVKIDAAYVKDRLKDVAQDQDLSKYIL
jgi:ATP-dependent HslUV protease ATP-binding subunit HslU